MIFIASISILLMGFITHTFTTHNISTNLGKQALELSIFIAEQDIVKKAYTSNNPTEILQAFVEPFHKKELASFVILMDMDGIILTHPNKELIGRPFTGGDEEDAINKGKSYISSATGVSGPSIRGLSPIYIDDTQVGVVAVGIFQDNINLLLQNNKNVLIYTIIFALLVAIIGAFSISHNIKETIFALEPIDIATLLQLRDLTINSVKEGIIFTDKEDKLSIINERACELLGLSNNDIGKYVKDVIPKFRMDYVRKTGVNEYNESQRINDIIIIINKQIIKYNDEVVGVVATFTEKNALERLAEELTNSQTYVEDLRAKTHEFMNQLQTISGLIELEEFNEVKKFIAKISLKNQDILKFFSDRINDSITVAFLLGKRRESEELGVKLRLTKDSKVDHMNQYMDGNAMVLILGNLINNSLEAFQDNSSTTPNLIEISLKEIENNLTITVKDNGPGLPDTLINIKDKGVSTKSGQRGFGLHLVNLEVTNILGGSFKIENRTDQEGTFAELIIPKGEY